MRTRYVVGRVIPFRRGNAGKGSTEGTEGTEGRTRAETRTAKGDGGLLPPEEREGLGTLLEELHGPLRWALTESAWGFVDWLWARRHLHWYQSWGDRLRGIDGSLAVCLARGRLASGGAHE